MDQYALYYDLLYANRDVRREVDFIESIIQRFSRVKVKKILDVGCGTGIHSIELGRRGYNVLGIDISEEMIKRAREKAKGMENVGFLVGDATNIVFNDWTIDLMNQLADVDISWSIVDLSKGSVDVFNHRIKLRLFTPREIKYILRDCGFQLCDIYPDYNQAPFSEGSPEIVVVVRAE
ncbi:MAG: class I SAM-dependent DNA methyltransferase [Candidatus Methanodesulfokora sp.]|jgi:SAM-dependent methyltransferase